MRFNPAATSTSKVVPMTEHNGPVIDRSIYVMPMFVNLVVSDLTASQALYAAAGFVNLATIPGPDGVPALVHLRREKYQDILITQGTPAPGSVSTSFAAAGVDLNEVAERLRACGAEVTGPLDTRWFTTDLSFTDLDGNNVTLTAPRMAESISAHAWVRERIASEFEW